MLVRKFEFIAYKATWMDSIVFKEACVEGAIRESTPEVYR